MRTFTVTTLLLISTAPAAADITVTINPDKDNTLCQYGDSSNALADLFVGRTGQADRRGYEQPHALALQEHGKLGRGHVLLQRRALRREDDERRLVDVSLLQHDDVVDGRR
jgi:hypothetical protein